MHIIWEGIIFTSHTLRTDRCILHCCFPREPTCCSVQGRTFGAESRWLNGAEIAGWRPEVKGDDCDATQEGRPVRPRWIRLHQEPPPGRGLRLHQEWDGQQQVPGYVELHSLKPDLHLWPRWPRAEPVSCPNVWIWHLKREGLLMGISRGRSQRPIASWGKLFCAFLALFVATLYSSCAFLILYPRFRVRVFYYLRLTEPISQKHIQKHIMQTTSL